MRKCLCTMLLVVLTSTSMYSCHWVTGDGKLFNLSNTEKAMLIEMFPEDADKIGEGKLTKDQSDAWLAHRQGSDYAHRKYSRLQPEFTGFRKVSDGFYIGTFVINGVEYEYTVTETTDGLVFDDNYTELTD